MRNTSHQSEPIKAENASHATASGKRRIKQNVWGNWYGYIGSKRAEAFFNTPEHSMEQNAKMWRDGKG